MKLKRALAFALSLIFVLSLAACGGDSGETSPSPDASPGASGEPSGAAPEVDVSAYTQAVAGVDPDTVLFTIDGHDVTAEYYFYWLSYDCTYWDNMSQMYMMAFDMEEILDEETGQTVGQFIKDDAQQMAAAYVLMEVHARELDCGATPAQLEEWEQFKRETLSSGDLETFRMFLAETGLSEETLDRIGMVVNGFLFSNLTDALVPQPTDEELDLYILESDTYLAKHILICTAVDNEDGTVSLSTGDVPTNEDGTPFTGTAQEYNDAARAKAESILAEIDAAADPLAKFDELMFRYSEDTGLAGNPDGYTFSSTTSFVEEFKNGVYDLGYNEHSGLVESVFGYHILLRLRPDVADDYRGDKMSDIVNGWLAEMEVVTTPEYDALDTAAFYAAYQEYQEALMAQVADGSDGDANDGQDPAAPGDGNS